MTSGHFREGMGLRAGYRAGGVPRVMPGGPSRNRLCPIILALNPHCGCTFIFIPLNCSIMGCDFPLPGRRGMARPAPGQAKAGTEAARPPSPLQPCATETRLTEEEN